MGKFFVALDFLVNLGGPFLVYQLAAGHMSETAALMLSSAPPILWSVAQLIWSRKLDTLSLLVIAGIALSLVATLLGGSPRLLLVRESLITGIFGLIFLGSLLFPKPLMFYIVKTTVTKQGMSEEAFASRWSIPGFRSTFNLMTVVWGAGLLVEATVKIILAFTMPTGLFLVVSPIISYGIYFGLLGWSIWYGNQRRKAGERFAAAAEELTGQ
ncbi:MAG TPA: VC0807 family protein [Chthoniobacterales bacterium]|jgi:intracellular septation protein A|nr:VC0807 family protein [Chthoniobacterales bacterium]